MARAKKQVEKEHIIPEVGNAKSTGGGQVSRQAAADEVISRLQEELQRKQRKLDSLKQQYDTLYSQSSLGYVCIDRQGVILKANPAAAVLTGQAQDDLCGKILYSWLREDEQEAAKLLVKSLFASNGKQIGQFCLRRRNGEMCWVRLEACLIPSDHDAPAGFVILHEIANGKESPEVCKNLERAKALLDALPDLMFRLDRDGVFLDYKAEHSDLYAQKEPDIIGKRNRDISPPAFGVLIDQKIALTLETGEMQVFDYQLRIPNQGLRAYEARMVPSGIDEVTAIVRDISEQRQLQEALLYSEERLRLFIKSASFAIWDWDVLNKRVQFSPRWFEIRGLSAEETSDHEDEWEKGIHPDDFERVMTAVQAHFLGETAFFEQEYRVQHANGDWRWILDRGIAQRDEKGEVFRMVGAEEDITARKHAEDLLKKNMTRFQNLVEMSMVGIFETNAVGDNTYVSPRWSEITGIAREKALGQGWASGLHPDDRDEVFHGWREAALKGEPYISEFRFVHPDGRVVWVLCQALSVRDEHGEISEWTGTINDITREKLAAEKLQKSQALLNETQSLSHVGGWEWDVIHQRMLWSEETYRIHGFSPEDFEPGSAEHIRASLACYSEKDQPIIQKAFDGCVKNGTPYSLECQITTISGEEKWVQTNGRAERKDGKVVRVTGNFMDITERKRVQQQLTDQLADLSLINEVNLAVNQGADLHEIVGIISRKLRDNLNCLASLMLLLDPSGRDLIIYHFDLPDSIQSKLDRLIGKPVNALPLRLSLEGNGILTDTVRMGNAVIIDDKRQILSLMQDLVSGLPLRKFASPALKILGIKSVMLVPLIVKDRLVGLLDLNREYLFTNSDLKRVEMIAQQLIAIIDRWHAVEVLRQSEENYRVLIHSMDNIIVSVDQHGRLLYVNENGSAWVNVPIEEMIGKMVGEFLPEDYTTKLMDMIQKVVQEDQGVSVEKEISFFDHPDWWNISIQPIHDESGSVESVLINVRNITDLKIAQQELIAWNQSLEERVRERAAEVQDLYDHAPAGYHSLDERGTYVRVNQTELDWLGYSREEVIGKPFPNFISARSLKTFQENFPLFKERGWVRDLEFEMIRKDGSILPVLLNSTVLTDEDGGYVESRSTIVDLTERKKMEMALRASREDLQNFLDTASDLIQSVDEDDRYQYVNQAWCSTMGYGFEEALQFTIYDIIDPEFHDQWHSIHSSLMEVEAPHQIQVAAWTKNGTKVYLDGTVNGSRDANGNMSTSCIFRDITLRRQAEEALRQSHEELRMANVMLEKAVRLKDQFLASMSHELRTPLTGILGMSEALQLQVYGDLNDKQIKAVTTIEESGRHLLDLINDILDISKMEGGKLDLQFQEYSVLDICQASLQLTKGIAHKKNILVQFDHTIDNMLVYVDPRRMKQILVNLLSNAIKFTPAGGSVGLEVSVLKKQQEIKFCVWDTGIGIPAENMDAIFQPFVQLDHRLSREYAGTGLGLPLVRNLTSLHGGRLEVESQPGEGSRFTVFLPWKPENQPTDRDQSLMPGASIQTQAAERLGSGKAENTEEKPTKVLVVDDTQTTLDMLADYLEARQFDVLKAKDGKEALSKIREWKPDIVLLDIQLPGMDGLEVIHRMRSHVEPNLRSIPIIALTALAMPGDRERCLNAGADGYLSKPVKLDTMVAQIQDVMAVK